jgi:hypothetical protein
LEFEEFLSEMFELLASGVLINQNDIAMWLEEAQDECKYSYTDLKEFVEIYTEQEFGSDTGSLQSGM